MTLFKNYFKLVRKNLGVFFIYFIIFFSIAAMNILSIKDTPTQYIEMMPDTVVINHDNHPISNGLEKLLNEKSAVKKVDESLIDDALFYRDVTSVIKIDKGFGELFLNDNHQILDVRTTGEASGDYIKNVVSRYLNAVKAMEAKDESEINQVLDSFKVKQNVSYLDSDSIEQKDLANTRFFYNGLNYPIIAQILLMVSIIMLIYNEKTIKMRQEVSAMSQTNFHFQMLLGHFVLGILVFLLYVLVAVGFTLYGVNMIYDWHYLFNTFIFTLSIVAMSYCLASVIKNRRVVSSLSTVVSLAASFLAGSFVPQEIMNPTVLNFSKIFPSYWFVRNNNLISNQDYGAEYQMNLIIMLGFIVIFFVITAIVNKVRIDKTQARS